MSYRSTRSLHSAPDCRLGAVWLALLVLLPAAAAAQPAGPGLRGIFGARSAGNPPEIAEGFLRANQAALGLEAADLDDWKLTDHTVTRRTGVSHLYYRQRLAGIEVRGGDLSVSVLPDGRLVGVRHRFVRDLARAANRRAPALTARQAVQAAATHLGLALLAPLETREVRGGPAREVLLGDGGISVDPIPVKLVYWPDGAGAVRLAWNLFVRPAGEQHWWNLDVDAVTGAVLAQTDWILNDSYRVFPLPLEDPDDGPRSLASNPAAASASPFGWHDTNGAPGAETSDTTGNNVLAQEDANGNDGTGVRPSGGPGLVFDFPLDFGQTPATWQPSATTNLFYWSNVLHDIHHAYGFDEASGNFQTNNYGNGGVGGDRVLADAQDGSALNNANFSRAAEGTSPRMQMFLWQFPGVRINTPAALAQSIAAGTAAFGPLVTSGGTTGDLALASPSDACTAIANPGAISGRIALVDRGTCTFVVKVANAQAAGAIAVLVANNAGDAVLTMGGTDPTITIRSMLIGQTHGAWLKDALASGPTNATLTSTARRDVDLDSGIIAHEYGHGVSIRLTGGPSNVSCLSLAQSAGMGEGWGDWWALALTALETDAPKDPRGIGAYAKGEGPSGPGIRNFRYSTNLGINPQTLSSINGTNQPHGVGEIWAQALWEVFWVLVGEHGFDPDVYAGTGGNNLALQLVMDALKLQSCEPTFLEARDAVLDADLVANGGANACLLWQAFAKRGMGTDANDTGNPNLTAVTDGFAVPGGCEAVCGNAAMDIDEQCDDGGTTPADGCSATCQVESFVSLYGTAQGGTLTLVVDGVTLQVETTAGQSAATVLAALAAAINSHPTLQGLGTTAWVANNQLVTDGEVASVSIDDPGLSSEPQANPPGVPALGPRGAALLVALLAGSIFCRPQPRKKRTRR